MLGIVPDLALPAGHNFKWVYAVSDGKALDASEQCDSAVNPC